MIEGGECENAQPQPQSTCTIRRKLSANDTGISLATEFKGWFEQTAIGCTSEVASSKTKHGLGKDKHKSMSRQQEPIRSVQL